MPQFRLTQKFATDCKIKQLLEPTVTTHILDDWFIDRIIVDRKKIAMITHGKSAFTFFIPYAEAGGAKEIFTHFKNQFKNLFQSNSLPALALEIDKLFVEEFRFTKTIDRKILGHMNDFKRCTMPYPGDPYPIDWQDKAERINNMPILAASHNAAYTIEVFNALLGINLPKRKN